MPNASQSPLQDGSAVTDADLAALLAGKRDVAPWLQPVADVVAALNTGPRPGELAGEARALAEFRRRTGVPAPRHRARRGVAGLTSRLGAKAAAGATAAAVVLGGAATAAFANVLPAPIQRFAHDVIGAPDAPSAPRPAPARGETAAPGQPASHGKPKASAKPAGTGQYPNRHGHRQPGPGQGQQGGGQGQQDSQHAKGQGGDSSGQGQPDDGQGQQGVGQGSPHAKGQAGDLSGQGQQGVGQGSPHAKGQGGDLSGQGQPSGGQGQQDSPHAKGQYRNPHPGGRSARTPRPSRQRDPKAKPAARHARPARHRPAMDI